MYKWGYGWRGFKPFIQRRTTSKSGSNFLNGVPSHIPRYCAEPLLKVAQNENLPRPRPRPVPNPPTGICHDARREIEQEYTTHHECGISIRWMLPERQSTERGSHRRVGRIEISKVIPHDNRLHCLRIHKSSLSVTTKCDRSTSTKCYAFSVSMLPV